MHENPASRAPSCDRTPSLARRLIRGFVKIGLALNRHDRKNAGSNGLGLTQTRILEFLRQCPKQSARLSAIAGELSITPATACESLRTLTQKGLVRKVRSATDERVVIITLSAKGHRKVDHAARQDGFLLAAAESLSPAEQEALFKTLRKLELAIQERRHALVAPRMAQTYRDFQSHVHPDPQRGRTATRYWTRQSAIGNPLVTVQSINRPPRESLNRPGPQPRAVASNEAFSSALSSTDRGELPPGS